MRIEVDTKGLDALLGRLKAALGDLSGFFKSAANVVLESVNRNFIEGGRPTAWKPLKPSSIRRRKGTGNPRILRDTGLLMASIGSRSGNGVYRLTPHSIEVGTNVPYAAAHQFGTKYMAARPFMVVQEKDVDDIVQIALDMITKAAK
jgi:phage virion morphogenesis protein